ncbi:MAG: Crp/Fnr family transcriptional regulator [Novosphingobium sp.]|nr:Crp/Fnr family transcriptional regulator [Novosphingobium sp.]
MTEADRLAAAMPFLATLSTTTLARLGERVRFVSVPPRAGLLQPGDAVSGAYFVETGAIRVHFLDAEGREGTLYRIGPGQSCIIALNCLFSAMRYPAWAEAGEDGTNFAMLDGADARELMSEDASFMKAIFEQVSTRLYDLLGTLEHAIRLPLEARLACLLLDLADDKGIVKLSQERLAAHLGTSREVVSRLLRTLSGEGLVESGYARLRVTDRMALERRSG